MFDRIVFDPSLGLKNQAMFKVKECLVQKISKELEIQILKIEQQIWNWAFRK